MLTICLRVIRNAWHFYYALRLVFKVVAAALVLRCSHIWSPPVLQASSMIKSAG
ncbi:hypothetical protein VCHA40P240_10362 [Vibrio chagasii]|nr:hypothetical protein VCHA40P240_10362 [Vibrio chagasii]